MTEPGGEPKALERVTAEMRETAAPEPDWDRLEQRLFARIDAHERSTRRAQSFRIVAVLAAAAAVLLVVSGVWRPEKTELAGTPAVAPPSARVFGPGATRVDGAALTLGDQVVADKLPLLVDHPGRARWTLDPESQATVTAVGAVLSLKLTHGALSAEVVPSTQPETFVVEVEGARVAVHGTAFRVVKSPEGVNVSVSEGVVAVGAQGDKPGYFLHAGDFGKFSQDGRIGEVKRSAVASPEPAVVEPKPAGNAKPALATSPSAVHVEKALDQISGAASQCFTASSAQGEVRVQVRTQLEASFGPDGKLRALTFEPPLAPAVGECVQRESATVRVPESRQGGSGGRALLLGS